MLIGIDARMYGLKHAGIGRYVENLVVNLLKIDEENDYTLFVRQEDVDSIKKQVLSIKHDKKLKFIVAEARHYTLKEQLLLPYLISRERLDLIHFPHFNVPLFCPTKFVVTIHDLLWHEMKGSEVTTLSGVKYFLKYSGYKLVFAHSVQQAEKIFVPTKWVKEKILSTCQISPDKIIVTYEGIGAIYLKDRSVSENTLLNKYHIKEPFLIYTGSAYPHKNLNLLFDAVKTINNSTKVKVELVIASARNVFRDRLSEKIKKDHLEGQVKILDFVPDEDLYEIYQRSLAFVFPSLSEGFGLPGLEAMASGAPVLAAANGALEEVYQDAALFFNPRKVDSLVEKVTLLQKNPRLKQELINKSKSLVKSYSFLQMAQQTLSGYQSIEE